MPEPESARDDGKDDHTSDERAVGRRSFLQYAGLGVGALASLSLSDSASAATDYETITISAGNVRNILVDGNTVLENKLYDVTADGAGVTFRLKDNATVRNIGVKGRNSTERFVFRVGGGANDITIDRVYTECFIAGNRDPGGILASKNSTGTLTIRGASIHGWGNNGLYASKTDADLYVSDSYFENNRTAHFRGGGDYHGNNRDAVFENCVCVIDDLSETPLYPAGGDRTVGYIARWGEVEVRNSHVYLDPEAPDIDDDEGGLISENSMCMRTDADRGGPILRVYDSEVSPRDRISGDVRYVQNVGSDPKLTPPAYAPTSAEDAASGYSGDGSDSGSTDDGTTDTSVAVSTSAPSDVGTDSATLAGSLDDLGGASSVDVAFDYRATGESSWNTTSGQTLSSTGAFDRAISGLSAGTDYEYRSVASASDGDTDTGTTVTFTAGSFPNELDIDGSSVGEKTSYEIRVSDGIVKGDLANDNDTIEGTTASGQVNGGVDTYDFAGEVTDVWVEQDVPIYVNGDRLDLSQFEYPNQLEIDGSSVGEKTSYEIRVSDGIVKGDLANGNDTIEGTTASGQVNGGVDTYDFAGEVTDVWVKQDVPIYVNGDRLDLGQFDASPAIDRFQVTETDSPNPHLNVTVEWDVSDADADLSSGTVQLVDSGGSVVGESTTAISGDVHYGVDYFEVKRADGETFDVSVTVTDAAGNEVTETTQVSE